MSKMFYYRTETQLSIVSITHNRYNSLCCNTFNAIWRGWHFLYHLLGSHRSPITIFFKLDLITVHTTAQDLHEQTTETHIPLKKPHTQLSQDFSQFASIHKLFFFKNNNRSVCGFQMAHNHRYKRREQHWPVNNKVLIWGFLVADRTYPGGFLLIHLDVERSIKALQVWAGECSTGNHQPHLSELFIYTQMDTRQHT